MNINIEIGEESNIDELEKLYDDLNDYLANGINYPGWRKGVYPIRENAVIGIKNKNLYVAKHNGTIAGAIILNHEPEKAYHTAKWKMDCDYSEVFVIHTFAVHPKFMKAGVGKALMNFAEELSGRLKIKAIRLDVYEGNTPAITLYEKCGFTYIATVDLGLGEYGLQWFKLYEKVEG